MKRTGLKSLVLAVPATQSTPLMGTLFRDRSSSLEVPEAIQVVSSCAYFFLASSLLLLIPLVDQSAKVCAGFVNPSTDRSHCGLANIGFSFEDSGCQPTLDPNTDGPTGQSPSRNNQYPLPWLNLALPTSGPIHGMGGRASGFGGCGSFDNTLALSPFCVLLAAPLSYSWLPRNRDLVLPHPQPSCIFRPPRELAQKRVLSALSIDF